MTDSAPQLPRIYERLHDELDTLEDLQKRGREIVDKVVQTDLSQALEYHTGTSDNPDPVEAFAEEVHQAMLAVGAKVEEALTDLTSEAFDAGFAFAEKRRQ